MADTVRIEIAVDAVDNTGKALPSIVDNLEKLARAASGAKGPLEKTSEQVTQFDKQADKTNKTLQSWAKQKWSVALEAVDKISPVLSTVKGVLSSLAGRAWNITLKAFDLVTAPVRGILNILKNPLFQAGSILGISIGLKDTIDTYKGFEAAMSQVQAVSGASASELEKLTDKAKEMGATTKFTAEESAEAFNYMAMAGWKTSDMMNGIEGILNLAAASGESLATTSDIVTDALTAFNMSAGDAGHFSDVLAAASSNANTNVSMMGETFKYVGAMAGTLGYSIEDTALAIGLMANAGIKSSQAGTELNSIFTRLSVNTNGARDAVEALGIKFYDSSGSARPFAKILGELREKTKNFTDEQKTNFANTVAGQRAQAGLLAMLNATAADYDKLTEAVNNADGASERMAETMLDNVQGSITLLQSALDGVKISAGERFAPYVRGLADSLTGAMPAIERGVQEFMDWFDGKVEQLKARFKEAVNAPGFEDMDVFGKVHILWDKIIAEPFSEWWNSGGKQMLANVAGDVGQGIGAGIRNGLLALLGIDLDDAQDAGASIAGSFVSGFKAGFDSKAVGAVVKTALGGMVASVGKLLPGGQAPGLDTAVSALVLSKIAAPVLAVGKGAATIGKSVFAPTPSGGTSLGATLLGSGATGKGLLGLGAKAATAMGAGDPIIGASLSSGAMSAVGLGSIAGGLIGGYSLFSGIKDLRTGFTSEDAEKAAAYKKAGTREVLGVGAGAGLGATVGATIGSAFFGVGAVPGALIGAGIGGIAGMMSGNKARKEYEEQAQAAREAADAQAAAHELIKAKAEYAGQSLQTVTFKSKELNEAFKDSEVTVDKFGVMFREAVSEKITSSFGNISLSMQEIKSLANSIVFDEASNGVEKFNNAVDASNRRLEKAKDNANSLEKMNWKASLGINFSQSELGEYQSQIDSFLENASKYIENKHYEATVALKMLTAGEGDTAGVDSAYAAIEKELADKSKELQTAVQKALKDGVISTEPVTLPDGTVQLSEYAEIENLQSQISEIMNRVSVAETNAKLDVLKIQYGGANLDAASFQRLQTELAENVESMTANYKDALTISLTNLNLQFPEGGEEFEAAKAQLEAEFNERMKEINLRVENFQLDTIAQAFQSDLEGILPDLTGGISERLKQAMDAALAVQPDPVQWTQEQVSQWFGLNGLDAETQAAVGGMLQSVAETIPQSIKAQLSEQMSNTDLTDALSNVTVDASGVTEALNDDVMEAVDNADFSAAQDALGDKVAGAFDDADYGGAADALNNADYSAITEAVDSNVTEAVGNAELAGAGDALETALGTELTDTLANADITGGAEALTAKLNADITDAVTGADFSAGMGVLKTGLETGVSEAISNPEISGAKEALRNALSSGIAEAISSVDLSAAYAALAALRQALESQAQATLGAQMTIQVPVNLTYNYNVTNPTPPKPTVTAQSASMNVGARANGGFTNGAELSWVGEDGPEAIIPLGAKRRGRGLELYKQVGEILGVAKNAEGGVYGGDTRINSIYGGSAYHNNAYSAPVFNGDSVSYQTDIANGGAFVSSAHHRQNVNQTAYDIQNNRAAAYRFVGGAISSLSKSRSETRGGDTYGGTEIYAAPVISRKFTRGLSYPALTTRERGTRQPPSLTRRILPFTIPLPYP